VHPSCGVTGREMADTHSGSPGRPRAAVVVLGDVGRSPRMQYHALSLAEQVGPPGLGTPLSHSDWCHSAFHGMSFSVWAAIRRTLPLLQALGVLVSTQRWDVGPSVPLSSGCG